jgi:hypothetical protein
MEIKTANRFQPAYRQTRLATARQANSRQPTACLRQTRLATARQAHSRQLCLLEEMMIRLV